jgi:hypothetical protein
MTRSPKLNKQDLGKRAVRKLQAAHLYGIYATRSEDKAVLRAEAEQAQAEWQNKRPVHRTSNLSDYLRKGY